MDEIVLHRIAFNVTFRCTLKCRLCCAYVPYYAKPVPHYSCSEVTKAIKRFFELVDFTDICTLTGGEPFLHDMLPNILDYARQYRARIGRLEVITNGTVLPSERLVQSLKAADARVLMDDYGPSLSVHASEIEEIFKESSVDCERRYNSDTEQGAYCNGWVDLLHFSDNPVSDRQAKSLFSRCVQANELRCNPVISGKIYACPAYAFCVRQGKVKDDPQYFIDLLDDSLPLDVQKRKMKEFCQIDVLPSCAYCHGWLPESKRYVPAEQI